MYVANIYVFFYMSHLVGATLFMYVTFIFKRNSSSRIVIWRGRILTPFGRSTKKLQTIMNSKDVKWHWYTIYISLIISCNRLFTKVGHLQLRGLLNQTKIIKTNLQLRGGYGMLLLWWWGSAIPEWQANNRKVSFHEARPFQRWTYYLS